MSVAPNVALMFLAGARRLPAEAPLALQATPDGLRSTTWAQAATGVEEIALGLLSLGLAPGDRVAFAAGTEPALPLLELAVLALRGSVVVLPPATPHAAFARFVREQGCPVLVAPDRAWANAVIACSDELPSDTRWLCADPRLAEEDERFLTPETLRERGRRSTLDEAFLARGEEARLDDEALVLFTHPGERPSRPRVLDHEALLAETEQALSSLPLTEGERFLPALPFSELAAWTAGFFGAVHKGAVLTFPGGDTDLGSLRALAPGTIAIHARGLGPLLIEAIEEVQGGPDPARPDLLPNDEGFALLRKTRRRRGAWSRAISRLRPGAARAPSPAEFPDTLRRILVHGAPVAGWMREAGEVLGIDLRELPGPHANDGTKETPAPDAFVVGTETVRPEHIELLLESARIVHRAFVSRESGDGLGLALDLSPCAHDAWQRATPDSTHLDLDEAVTSREADRRLVHGLVARVNALLPEGLRIRSVRVCPTPWTSEDGALTPFGGLDRVRLAERLSSFPLCPPVRRIRR